MRTLACLQCAAGAILLALLFMSHLEAHEPPTGLLAHLTFDGTLADATGNGFVGEAIGKGDTPATAKFAEGKYGQALRLDGSAAVVVPLDLHFDQYPEVTVTGWIYLEDESARGTVIATGSGDGPELRVLSEGLYADRPGGGRVEASYAFRHGIWQFFAGTWDYRSGTIRLNWRARSMQEEFETNDLDPPGQDLFVGVANERFNIDLQNAMIDDLRIYGRKLSEDELVGLRLGPASGMLAGDEATRPRRPADGFDRISIPGDQFDAVKIPGDQFDPARIPGDQFACRSIPGDQFECTEIPGDQFEKAAIPGDQFDGVRIPGDQFDVRKIPGDQFACRSIPGDQFECTEIPGDQFGQLQIPGDQFDVGILTDPTVIPGDQFDPTAIPGDQFACKAIPGDQFECSQIPGDQFEKLAIPANQFDGVRIPGDQFDIRKIPGDQFACRSIPGDQFECVSIPGDQF